MKRDPKEIYKTRSRNEQFAPRIRTRIWSEIPTSSNPYIAEQALCHGYDVFDLIEQRSFIDVFFLLFRGELPTSEQARVLEILLIGLINPGPRHPASRAAMNAGIGKTDTAHILPIAQLTLGGSHLGGQEVTSCMRFLNKSAGKTPEKVTHELIAATQKPEQGDWHIAPGFGTRFGGVDIVPTKLAEAVYEEADKDGVLSWAMQFTEILRNETGCSWLNTGIAAAVFSHLGFHPRSGAGLFQLITAPGLLAHGLEMANKPLTAMPFIDDDHYVIQK